MRRVFFCERTFAAIRRVFTGRFRNRCRRSFLLSHRHVNNRFSRPHAKYDGTCRTRALGGLLFSEDVRKSKMSFDATDPSVEQNRNATLLLFAHTVLQRNYPIIVLTSNFGNHIKYNVQCIRQLLYVYTIRVGLARDNRQTSHGMCVCE